MSITFSRSLEYSDFDKTANTSIQKESYIQFDKAINKQIDFLVSLAGLFDYNGKTIVFVQNGKTFLIGSQLIESSYRTLNSVRNCCKYGNFSDADVLIRKYRDDFLLYILIIVVNNHDADSGIDPEKLEHFKATLIAWRSNGLDKFKRHRNVLCFENYMKTIKKSKQIRDIIEQCNLKDTWSSIGKQLNDSTHNNGYKYTMNNLVMPNVYGNVKV